MKTAVKLTGFAMMLSFLVFVWLSHTGVMPGSFYGHFLGGLGMFILAVCGFAVMGYTCDQDSSDRLFNPLMFFSGLLLALNAVLYILLKTANLIGPYPEPKNWDPSDIVLLGILYIVLAICGLYAVYSLAATEN